MGYSFFLKLKKIKKSIIFNIENMSDRINVGVVFTGPRDEQRVTTMEQFEYFMEVPAHRMFSRIIFSVTTPNDSIVECVLDSPQGDMTGHFEMCDELVTALFASRDPYMDLTRFRNAIFVR